MTSSELPEPDDDCFYLATLTIGEPKSEGGDTPDSDVTSLARAIEAAIDAWCLANEYTGPPTQTVDPSLTI